MNILSNNKSGKMFITDFDGTFLRSDYSLCENDINAVKNLKNQGIITAVATGRSVFSFDMAMSRLKTKPDFLDYLVFSTGAGILSYPDKKIIKSENLNPENVYEITKILQTGRIDHMINMPVPYTREFVYVQYNKNNSDFNTRLKLYKDFCTPLDPDTEHEWSTHIIAVIPDKLKKNQTDFIFENLKPYNIIKTTSPLDNKSLWLEIFPPGVSKSSAVSWLASRLEIERKNVLSIGNDYNDKDLLHWSGSSFITENAPEDLKKIFKNAPSNDYGAVKTAISNWSSENELNISYL